MGHQSAAIKSPSPRQKPNGRSCLNRGGVRSIGAGRMRIAVSSRSCRTRASVLRFGRSQNLTAPFGVIRGDGRRCDYRTLENGRITADWHARTEAGGIRATASHYGIDLGQQVEQTQQTAANYDPRFDQFIAMQQQQEQQRAAVAKQQMESEVGRWLEETDPQGKPLRPFASNVVSELKALIPGSGAKNPGASVPQIMEEAYVRAVWANPATRAVLEQQKQAELEATRRAENQRRIEEAKKAASVNVARRGVAPPRPGPMPMDQFIGEQARTLGLLP